MSNRSKYTFIKTCELCGKTYETHYKKQRFCTRACTNKYLGTLRRKDNCICKKCGKSYYDADKHVFCSDKCKKQWKYDRAEERKHRPHIYKTYEKTCEECGQKFMTHNKKTRFCSLSCSSTHNNRKLIKYKKCKNCGQPFHKSSMDGVIFCSDECRKKYNEKKREELKKVKNEKWIKNHTKTCTVCGRVFVAKNLSTICCSNECIKKFNNERSKRYSIKRHRKKLVECKNCGTIFETEYGDKRSVFCCLECRKHYVHYKMKNTERGKEKKKLELKRRKRLLSQNFVETVSYEELYKRDNGICQICGLPVLEKGVDYDWSGSVDHIKPLSLGGEHSMSNCQLSHRICNSLKLQEQENFKINWDEKIKCNDYWKRKFEKLKELLNSV